MCTKPMTIVTKYGEEVHVPCGKCQTCLKKKARNWAIKLINESKYYKKCAFITVTFDNKIITDREHIAVKKYGANASFVWNIENSKEYFKKFIKRLRKKLYPLRIKYFHIGEYGEKNHRPHHHAIIFGTNFDFDRKEAELSKTGKPQFYSQTLEDCWSAGRTRLQDVNSNNIIYVAQYNLKKFKLINGQKKYKSIMSFSNRGKMNIKFIRKHPEVLSKGYINDSDGKKYSIPRSYLDNLKKESIEYYHRYYEEYEEKQEEILANNEEMRKLKYFAKNKEVIFEKTNLSKTREF